MSFYCPVGKDQLTTATLIEQWKQLCGKLLNEADYRMWVSGILQACNAGDKKFSCWERRKSEIQSSPNLISSFPKYKKYLSNVFFTSKMSFSHLMTEREWILLPLVHSTLLGLSSGDKTSPPLKCKDKKMRGAFARMLLILTRTSVLCHCITSQASVHRNQSFSFFLNTWTSRPSALVGR